MKYLGWILFVPTLIWAGVATNQVIQLKKSPIVLSVLPDGQQNKDLGQVEKISFIRQFVDRYTSFDHDNFWQSQAALSYLMSPELRDQRLGEVNRLKEKIRKNMINQKGHVTSIRRLADDRYQINATIDLLENRSHALLLASIEMKLSENPRSLDNPWGFVVNQFKVTVQKKGETTFDSKISMKMGSPLILSFPCAVENFEVPDSSALRVKITTFNVSEIQLYPLKDAVLGMNLKAICKDREYALNIADSAQHTDLFVEIPENHGRNRQQLTKKKPAKNPYQKTMENELGFVIEE